MERRQLLQALGALPVVELGCSRREADVQEPQQLRTPAAVNSTMPVVFAAHGAPVLLDDAEWLGQLAAWSRALPPPRAVLMVSAHWQARPATYGATRPVPLIYDFSGFPERYYQTTYAAPGASALAAQLRELFGRQGLSLSEDAARGLDHGAYVPLLAMYPEAKIPVLQLSLPGLDPAELFRHGQALAPLRREGVLIFGSGFLTHNMRYAGRRGVPDWAREFDAWASDALTRFDVDALLDFRARAPAAAQALPTWEHYAPLLVAAGAAAENKPRVSFPITGWWMDGPFTKRSVELA